MNVIFLAWRDLRHPEAGGSERYVHSLATHLVARGHRVSIVSAQPGGLASRESLDSVDHRRRGGRISVYLHGVLAAAVAPPNTVIVDVINGVPFGAAALPRRRVVGLIHHVHRHQWQMIFPGTVGRLGWFLESRVTPALYRWRPVVTVSDASRRDLVALGYPPDRVMVVRNGVDLTATEAVATERHHVDSASAARPRRLVVLARLVPHKQIDHALAVVAALQPSLPEIHLDILGEGKWREALAHEARRLGITDHVQFHGHVSEATKAALLVRADLLVMPSAKEGWGLAVSEAGAHGVPAIGYRSSGGLTESILDGETGWLVDDLSELIARVRTLLEQPRTLTRAGESARDFAHTLTWHTTVDAFERVLKTTGQRDP